MIPAKIDFRELLKDLNKQGLSDRAVELLCAFTAGYLSQIKCGNITIPNYEYAARMYNLWYSQCVPQETLVIQQVYTST